MKQKVLITGIEGFTGIHLSHLLVKKGYAVYGTSLMNSQSPNIFTCNIMNRLEIETIVHDISPDFVVHLAGIAFVAEKNTSLMYDVNVIGTGYLLEALTHLSCKPQKVILASSATVYGNQHCDILDESMIPKPVNHYGFSKLSMEHLAATYFEKLPIIVTRPFNYTGTGQGEQFLIPKIVKHYQENQSRIELGNLHVAREFNDVRDIAKWYADLLTCKEKSEIVNLCSGKAISLLEIISLMNGITSYGITVKVNPAFVRDNEIQTLFGSTEKLHRMISCTETISIQDTLNTMYQYHHSI